MCEIIRDSNKIEGILFDAMVAQLESGPAALPELTALCAGRLSSNNDGACPEACLEARASEFAAPPASWSGDDELRINRALARTAKIGGWLWRRFRMG
ncbi:MAG: hypothetical protein L0Y57_07645 [Beijerinckiaceae bacterium]|nr:hypothetical protein [Beijerinckiaceae bacterium]